MASDSGSNGADTRSSPKTQNIHRRRAPPDAALAAVTRRGVVQGGAAKEAVSAAGDPEAEGVIGVGVNGVGVPVEGGQGPAGRNCSGVRYIALCGRDVLA